VPGSTYYILSSTNVLLPLANWQRLATNVFGSGGEFVFTEPLNPALPRSFYALQVP